MAQCLPILNSHVLILPVLDVKSINEHAEELLHNGIIYCEPYEGPSLMRKQVNIDQEQIKSVLENIEIGHYLEFILTYGTYSRKNDNDKILAHSILIYKAENSKYIFFDSNKGAVGFCPDTGIASLTPKEICKTLELAVNSSLYYQYIENFPVFSDGCFTWVIFRNATLMLKKAEQFYKTKTNPNSKIIEISVDKNTNNLVFTPVLP